MPIRFILAVSGGLGSGKSTLTTEVAARLGWARASFGDQVKKVAAENNLDATDRAVLQNLGQALVLTKLEDFIEETLAQAQGAEYIVLDGIRHVEVLLMLKQKYHEAVRLVHLDVPSDIRQERYIKRENVERRLLARYESDITEAQIARILPQYADLSVNGTLPTAMLSEQVVAFARREADHQTRAA
ncbi:AAA family ATPase [Bradyrhizobium diazoefficiens]|uniref:AAA family ATPase n=1 Tax=Bradyrhizobium diazoefficiens TaxID=1355477 RepID=UPI0015B3EBA5|nr:AAA family ATPase [Bradyrhizobium diazoefficiens]QLD46694.1 AAA family ATPase [Bradyrhizobium diazoefficiens]